VLGIVFLAVALAFAWQERRSLPEDVAIYSVEDSIAYVAANLSSGSGLRRSDIRRILEWEVRYLQDPAVRKAGGPIVAGGLPSAEFAQESLMRLGHGYDGPDIIEVLDLRAGYLQQIGAIGEPLTAEEVASMEVDTE